MSAQTVQQIPAEDFGPIIDGHAWWIVDNRRIDVSTMATGPNSEFVDSPDGITPFHVDGHTFPVEVACTGTLRENSYGGLSCDGGCGDGWPWGVFAHRLSIVPGMILPILDRPSGPRDEDPAMVYAFGICWWLWRERSDYQPVHLPSGARPDRWAVQCKVAS